MNRAFKISESLLTDLNPLTSWNMIRNEYASMRETEYMINVFFLKSVILSATEAARAVMRNAMQGEKRKG